MRPTSTAIKFKIEEGQPLAIIVLFVGVGGGLLAVVGVIYLYKWCLPPINQDTKSGPGAFNRKMVADPFSSKPLSNPLANGKVISETEPLFNHFSPALKAGPAEYQQNKSTLFEFANDTKNIAQIFPLMNTSDGQSRHPQQQSKSLDEPSNQKCSIQSSKRKDYCSVDDQTSRKTQDHKAGDGMNQSSRHNSQFSHLKTLESKQGMHLLQTQQATARAVSATDMPCSSLAVDQQQEEELRRASFDVATASRCAAYYLRAGGWPTPGGQRRKLPSTEHLEASSTLPASINNTQVD
uniref:Uncharacterized protein n=1 Tax=Ditylenchus dipsaci TaxID=166011 RepID=A0A915EIG7_9BILA